MICAVLTRSPVTRHERSCWAIASSILLVTFLCPFNANQNDADSVCDRGLARFLARSGAVQCVASTSTISFSKLMFAHGATPSHHIDHASASDI